jgi:hypothetical protein
VHTAVGLRDIEVDEAVSIVDGIGEGAKICFTGKIEKVTIDVK